MCTKSSWAHWCRLLAWCGHAQRIKLSGHTKEYISEHRLWVILSVCKSIILSVCYLRCWVILSVPVTVPMLRVWCSQGMLRVELSVHQTVLTVSFPHCHVLRVSYSQQAALRVSYSQRAVLRVWEYNALSVRWEYHTLRATYDHAESIILSAHPAESIIILCWVKGWQLETGCPVEENFKLWVVETNQINPCAHVVANLVSKTRPQNCQKLENI